jgi:cardiolipin synthase
MDDERARPCQWFATGDETFAAAGQAVRAARQSVRLEVYIYTDCGLGRRVRDELVAAAERGVAVRVLVDAVGSFGLPESFWFPLLAAGGEVRWFNPLSLGAFAIRNHRKLLVCDAATAFLGGFNIAHEWEGDGITRGWRDLALRVEGTVAAELAGSFDHLYARADLQHRRFYRLRRSTAKTIVPNHDWQLLFSGPGRGRNPFLAALSRSLAGARRVQIVTPYFLPPARLRRRLARAARRGARVQLILPGKSDIRLSRLAGQSLYRRLLKAGIEIHEYQPQILHTKLYLVDDAAFVGSANLDPRSLRINYELMVRFTDPVLVTGAQAMFQATLAHSRQVDPAAWHFARNPWQRLQQRWAHFILARLDPWVASWQYRKLLRAGHRG